MTQPYERMGGFYLGKAVDPSTGTLASDPLVYDARDLTTHAVCVGMTGSGKTGLCIGLLEEAALDGVPAIIIDPKGDISNLLLTFPQLRPADFEPWINLDDARRKNLEPGEFAARTATQWREGLAEWGQEPERIARLKESADFRIFTPGSSAGEPVSILSSLKAPAQGWDGHEEELREQIQGTVSALLGLAGLDADPMRSPEHILLSTLFEHAWKQGQDLDLATLINSIQSPPVRKLGVFDVDTFIPAKDRFALAMALNNIMASPSFSEWLQGVPLDIGALLYAENGKPRHAVFSIAHLDDAQRMFFVTLLLEQTLAWVRRQSGTTSLRALLYMDEIFGFLPPTANPPAKKPLLTLLKQARAFGMGLVLATQNPVDLDYKAMSNAGTWFIGKLQTDRDKDRILDGLQSVAGDRDRQALSQMIGSLGQRMFLLHNVHEDEPVVFNTRWVMSYLRGPLTRDQIRLLKEQNSGPLAAGPGPATPAPDLARGAKVEAPPTASQGPPEGYLETRPALAPSVPQVFFPVRRSQAQALDQLEAALGKSLTPEEVRLVYRPCLVAMGQVAFVDRRRDVDAQQEISLMLDEGMAGAVTRWAEGEELDLEAGDLESQPIPGALFSDVPGAWTKAAWVKSATRDFKDWLYQEKRLEIFHLPALKIFGEVGETREAFLGRARLAARENRDAEVDKLTAKVQKVMDRLEKRLDREQRELGEDQAEYEARKREELLSAGETLVGMLGIFGRRKRTGLATASRKRRMTNRAKEDIRESQEEIQSLQKEIEDIKRTLQDDVQDISARWDALLEEVETFAVKPRRTDVRVDVVALGWAPYWDDPSRSGVSRQEAFFKKM